MRDYYFAGECNEITAQYKRQHNLNQLLSQLNDRKDINDWVEYKKEHPECTSKLFIDSGAFSVAHSGKTVDVDAYIDYINSIDEYVTIFAQVDVIPKNMSDEEKQQAAKESWDNYLYMVDRVKSPEKLLPVYHQGDDLKWLTNMLDYKYSNGEYIKYIGISANKSLGKTSWKPFFDTCMNIIQNHPNKNVQVHAFGTTSALMIESYQFTSVDSTTWLKQGIYGTLINNQGRPMTALRRSDHRGIGYTDAQYIMQVCTEYPEYFSHITNPEQLLEDRVYCQLFNLINLHKWISSTQDLSKNVNLISKVSLW